MDLKYVRCSWNMLGTPEVNYTFYSWSNNNRNISECTHYLSEKNINTGCDHFYDPSQKTFHFMQFHTKLVYGNNTDVKDHNLKMKVKLNPPINLTVQKGSDGNLWYYWNQTASKCVESDVRFNVNNNNKWGTSKVSTGKQSFCINLPSSSSQYVLQVRSKMAYSCGDSLFWSNWSEPVVWGSNNSTDTSQMNGSVSVWTLVLYVLGATTLILLAMMLLYHERIRIVLIPVVPKPFRDNIEDLKDQLSKGLKESYKANYNERACPVREYCHVSQSDSESCDSSTFSVTTDQTNCSVSIPVDESCPSTPCNSSISSVVVSSQEVEQVSV
ncbi:cytokine receptor common subunit gamma-like isoform X2 [Pempheris klunzingeri]